MNIARKRLIEYQETFLARPLSDKYDGFNYRAYPETAEKIDLDLIGVAVQVAPREINESQENFRARILNKLQTNDTFEEQQL